MAAELPVDTQPLEQGVPGESAFYKLIHVGNPALDSLNGGYAISCYFQPWLVQQNRPASPDVECHPLNSAFADKLICGTLWTKANGPDKTLYVLPTEYQRFSLTSTTLYARYLKQVVAIQALPLPEFWQRHGETWVVCLQSGDKKILIPYFELLRALFYQASRRLTNFIFSQTPLQFLCRPLMAPDAHNEFTARFCAVTTDLTAQEARLLGCLLFDPEVRYAFNMAQVYWLISAPTGQVNILGEQGPLAVGNFSNLSFTASGHHFSHGDEDFFWVHQLEVSHYAYRFQNLLFYPLAKASEKKATSKREAAAGYSDIFQLPFNRAASPTLKCRSLETLPDKSTKVPVSTTTRKERYASYKAGMLPLVVRRPTWAAALPKSKNHRYVDDNSFKGLVHPLPINPSSRSVDFSRLIKEFESRGYPTNPLTLNNPEQVFGKHLSVHAVAKYTPLPGTIYAGKVHCFSLVEVTLLNTSVYVAQPFPETNPELTLLIIKQNLTQPSASELSSLLSNVIPVYKADDLDLFYKKANKLARTLTADNAALLAIPLPTSAVKVDFCLALVEHIANRFRKRLALVLAISLRYPQGLTVAQSKAARKAGSYVCRAPDRLWLAQISSYWVTKRWDGR